MLSKETQEVLYGELSEENIAKMPIQDILAIFLEFRTLFPEIEETSPIDLVENIAELYGRSFGVRLDRPPIDEIIDGLFNGILNSHRLSATSLIVKKYFGLIEPLMAIMAKESSLTGLKEFYDSIGDSISDKPYKSMAVDLMNTLLSYIEESKMVLDIVREYPELAFGSHIPTPKDHQKNIIH